MKKRELVLRANPEHFADIKESFRRTRKEGGDSETSPYWEHHRALAGVEILDEASGLVRIHGESGFYFPGRSYSELEWVNTVDRLSWLALRAGDLRADPLARKALGLSIPHGRKGSSHFGYAFPGRRTSYDFLRAQYHLASVATHLPESIRSGRERTTIMEIGPGTGLLALAVKLLFPNSVFLLVDLPEILPFSSLFLTTVLPEMKFLFLNRMDAVGDGWRDYDFVFLTPDAVRRIPPHSVHLALNTDSMQEMELDTIRAYFSLLRCLLAPPTLFYSSNRVEKWIGDRHTRLADYPYGTEDRDLFSRENAFMRHRWIWKKFHYRLPYPWREPRRSGETVIQKLTVLHPAPPGSHA
jgi:hypothetical protein